MSAEFSPASLINLKYSPNEVSIVRFGLATMTLGVDETENSTTAAV